MWLLLGGAAIYLILNRQQQIKQSKFYATNTNAAINNAISQGSEPINMVTGQTQAPVYQSTGTGIPLVS